MTFTAMAVSIIYWSVSMALFNNIIVDHTMMLELSAKVISCVPFSNDRQCFLLKFMNQCSLTAQMEK